MTSSPSHDLAPRFADQRVMQEMRSDWDDRAQEDANYYVAFCRRNQPEDEFFASAADQIRLFETELKRHPAELWKQECALEIGCGPGRLLRPLSRHFRQIHGVDISERMLERAEENLKGVPNCALHRVTESNLSHFADASMAFVYSYAVFQHIPSKQVVFAYLADAVRVLRPGGLIVFQVNGLEDFGHIPTTWEGCRISAAEITEFALANHLRLLALTNRDTQYMWVTYQRADELDGHLADAEQPVTNIYKVANLHTGESAVTARGRFSEASIGVTQLPRDADLLSLSARVDGADALCTYVSPVTNGRHMVAIVLPLQTRTGLVPVALRWNGSRLSEDYFARVLPPAPRIASVSFIADGVNRLSLNRVDSGWVKIAMDEIEDPTRLRINVSGIEVPYDWCCVNPLHERYEFNFRLPVEITAGNHSVELLVGGKRFAPLLIEVIRTP